MALLKCNDMQDSLQIRDQILRVDDDKLTARLPGRRSNRNRVIYNPTSKASLPGRISSRNREIFKKLDSHISYPVTTEQGKLPDCYNLAYKLHSNNKQALEI